MDSFNGSGMFEHGQKMQMDALQKLLSFESQERAQRTQDNLQAQREQQNQLAEARAAQQSQRDSARDLYQAAVLNNQEEAVRDRERNRMIELRRDFTNDYYRRLEEQHKRIDRYDDEINNLTKALEGSNPAQQARLAQMRDWMEGRLIPEVAKRGQLKDINSLVGAIYPQKGTAPMTREVLLGVLGPKWQEIQESGQVDPESIAKILTPYLQEKLAEQGYNPNLAGIKARVDEYMLKRQQVQQMLDGTGPNKFPTVDEWLKINLGPTQEDSAPPNTSAKKHLASGMVMIGNLPNSRPVHINPTSFGGTVKDDATGKMQIVPSSSATFSDLAAIEALNKSGGKILEQPMLEGEVDEPAKENEKIPGNVTQPVSKMAESNEQVKRGDAEKVLEALKGEVEVTAGKISGLIAQTKKNPYNGFGYDAMLDTVLSKSHELSRRAAESGVPVPPEKIYSMMVTMLKDQGLGVLETEDDQYNKLQRLDNAWQDFTFDRNKRYGPTADPKMLARMQQENPSPWLYGKWVLPSADEAGYNYLKAWRNSEEVQKRAQGSAR